MFVEGMGVTNIFIGGLWVVCGAIDNVVDVVVFTNAPVIEP
jgi:hypothetical protein